VWHALGKGQPYNSVNGGFQSLIGKILNSEKGMGVVVAKISGNFDHAFNVINDKGVLTIVDPQDGTVYKGIEGIKRYMNELKNAGGTGNFELFETTNLPRNK